MSWRCVPGPALEAEAAGQEELPVVLPGSALEAEAAGGAPRPCAGGGGDRLEELLAVPQVCAEGGSCRAGRLALRVALGRNSSANELCAVLETPRLTY